jgi:thiamine-monophosphate kinase
MFENKSNRTELREMGEFGLIRHLAANIKLIDPSTVKGIGDDCAVIRNNGSLELVTCDMLLENVHFDLAYTPLKHLGYKSVVVNLSDIYAMNGRPRQIVVALGLSNRFSLEAVEELYAGMMLACEKYSVDLVGGDTAASHSGLVINITALGTVEEDKIVYREGAKENDIICVTGDLGGAYMGLQILNREKKIFLENPKIQPDLEGSDYIVERQLKPEARKDIIELFARLNMVPTSMIDISDGLSSELFHICNSSSKGCRIYEEKIPVDVQTSSVAQEMNLNPVTTALNGGEDYELLFTIRQSDFEKLKDEKEIHFIGHITSPEAGLALIDKGGHETPLKAQGWNALQNYNHE